MQPEQWFQGLLLNVHMCKWAIIKISQAHLLRTKERNVSRRISDKQSSSRYVANFVEGTCFSIADAITYGISTATAIAVAVAVAIWAV